MNKFELHIDIVQDNTSILSAINTQLKNENIPLTQSEIKQAIQKGALWHTKGKHTKRLRRIKKPLNKNETLHFYYNADVLKQQPPTAELIHDFKEYSIWYKPYGMLSQGSKYSDHCTITRWAQTHLTNERPSFIVHRIDRAATGLIIVAHSKAVARSFSQIFERHNLSKHYQIIVHGDFSKQKTNEITTDVDGKSAKSTFTFVSYNKALGASLVDVIIETGRKHQIRKHAANIGFPVLGDRLHGNKSYQYNETVNLQLCAVYLAFTCPITQEKRQLTLHETLRPSFDKILLDRDFTPNS